MEAERVKTIEDTEGCTFDIVCDIFELNCVHVGVYPHPKEKNNTAFFYIDWDEASGERFNCPDGMNVQFMVIQEAYDFLKNFKSLRLSNEIYKLFCFDS
jgi:hypothetical protein